MMLEEIKKILLFWSDVHVLPLHLRKKNRKTIYNPGTIEFIYDDKTNLLNLQGLPSYKFNYTGTLEEFIGNFEIWS